MDDAQLNKLSEYDFILVLDRSGSMGEDDMPGGRSRWEYMSEAVTAFARDVGKIDSDGIGLVVFGGGSVTSEDGCNVDKVKQVLASQRPSGGTPLAQALEAAFKLAGKSDKKDFIAVFTDGVPDDKKAAADVIRKQSNSQESDDACTVLFVQVGKDPAATSYLTKLDDDLSGCKFDIVDRKTMDELDAAGSIGDLIIAAIND